MQDMDVKAILVHTARDPANAALFNYASMAFNNHFFFKYIVSAPGRARRPQAG